MPGGARGQLHLRVAQVLEGQSPPPVPALARHFRAAAQTAQWCRYAEQAADLALASGDEVTAVALLHDLVVNAALPPGTVVRLVGKIPFVGLTEHAQLQGLIRALRTARDSGALTALQLAEAGFQLGLMLLEAGERQAGAAELERAIPALEHRPVDVVRSMIRLGWPDQAAWSAEVHRRWLDRAAAVMAQAWLRPDQRLPLACNWLTALPDWFTGHWPGLAGRGVHRRQL